MYYAHSGDWLFTVARIGRVWSTGDWSKIAEVPYVKFHGNFTPDGRWVVGMNGDRKAMIWSYKSGGVVADLEMDGGVYQIGFTVDGKYLLTAVSMKSMILDLTSGTVIDPNAFGKKRTDLRMKRTGKNTATFSIGSYADDDAPVHLIEPGKTKPVAALGRGWLGQQDFVDVIDLSKMRRLARLKPKEGVTHISFSFDDSLIAIQGSKATVWRVKRRKKVASLKGSGRIVFSTQSYDLWVADGHSLRVYSPNRRRSGKKNE